MKTCKDCFHYDVCQYHITEETNMTVNECSYKFVDKEDVAEVRHGEWQVHQKGEYWHYDCPFCEDGYATKEEQMKPPNYCGNCGAKMDGKDKSTDTSTALINRQRAEIERLNKVVAYQKDEFEKLRITYDHFYESQIQEIKTKARSDAVNEFKRILDTGASQEERAQFMSEFGGSR